MSSPNRPTIPFAPTLEVPGADMHLRLASVGSAEEFAAMCHAGGEALARFVPQLGAFMLPAYWGQGLARQAIETVLEYAGRKEVWGLKRVLAKAAIDNERSEGGLRRLGFQVTGGPFVDEEDFRATGVRQTAQMWSRPI